LAALKCFNTFTPVIDTLQPLKPIDEHDT